MGQSHIGVTPFEGMGYMPQPGQPIFPGRAVRPALLLALKSKETPIAAKLLAGITVAYALSPIDLIPDVLPLLGVVDDLVLVPLAIGALLRRLPAGIRADIGADAADSGQARWRPSGRP